MFKITYYGVRGSIPVSGNPFREFGGNTTCVLVETDDEFFILDSGSGIRELGNDLLQRHAQAKSTQPIEAYLLYTHYHWDHIQGFPFFVPAYIPKNRFTIFGESKQATAEANRQAEVWDVHKILSTQQNFVYFPAPLDTLASERIYCPIEMGMSIEKGHTKVTTFRQNHPNSSLSFRFDFEGRTFVFATDVEYTKDMHQPFVQFAQGAQVLAFDCQYTPDEYPKGKIGWGHSTYEHASFLASDLNLEELHMIHHDPLHDDKMLHNMQKQAQKLFKHSYMIAEGYSFTL